MVTPIILDKHDDEMVFILLTTNFNFILPYQRDVAFVFKIYYTTIKKRGVL
jgi:hypothetical protein